MNTEQLLSTIRQLDQVHATGNRLPIYLLRAQLPALPREELDRLLFVLVGLNLVRLAALQETHAVTAKQLAAGIPSLAGGPRFYIVRRDQVKGAGLEDAPAAEVAPSPSPSPDQAPALEDEPEPTPGFDLAVRLRDLRTVLGLSQAALAELLGVRRLTIVRWERGDPAGHLSPVLSAALEAHRRGVLPQTNPADGRWGWYARLFGALS